MPVATKPKPAVKATAKVAKPKTTATKAAPKAAAKPAVKAATKAPATVAKKAIDVKDVIKRLKAGETMTSLRSDYGAGTPIRRALLAAGYNTKGERVEAETISTNGGAKATAKRIAAARQDNWPWYRIETATGLTETQLREMLSDNGYADLVTGRVPKGGDDKPAAKKAPAKAAPAAKPVAAKAKPAAKPAATKAAVKPATTAKKPAPRRVGAKRPQTDA
jgi:hypothetical protein